MKVTNDGRLSGALRFNVLATTYLFKEEFVITSYSTEITGHSIGVWRY